jgi:hypothetical protein
MAGGVAYNEKAKNEYNAESYGFFFLVVKLPR